MQDLFFVSISGVCISICLIDESSVLADSRLRKHIQRRKTGFSTYNVNLEQIESVSPPVDGIPATHRPRIISVTQADHGRPMVRLTFEPVDVYLEESETGSTWNGPGQAVDGPSMGRQPGKLNSGVHFAFAWLAFNPDPGIYRGP